MKKLILSLSLVTALFIACKKEERMQPLSIDESAAPLQTATPASFTQKLLIEMLSSANCATCPDAEQKFRNIAAAHPGRVFGVSIHNSDAMETPFYDFIDSVFSIPYYASGMLNRTPFGGAIVLPKGDWNENINTCLKKTASCGLKINSSISGSNATIDVFSAFNTSLTGDYRVTVYLFEDNVTGTGSGYNQANYYNNTANSPFYQLGNPIMGFEHDFVIRKVLTQNPGDVINANQIHHGSCVKRTFAADISGYDAAELYVIAFINKVTNSNMSHEIMNVQQTKLGTIKDYD